MKKILSTVIAICCIATALTSCSSNTQNNVESTAQITVITSQTSTTAAETTQSSVNIAASQATSQQEETTVTSLEDSIVTIAQPVPQEKLDLYKSIGTVYYDDSKLMCANLTQDENGYHLAMTFSDTYTPEENTWFVTFKEFGDSETSFIVLSDGTQIESDNITVSGCFECLRILDVSCDGSRAWDLALYPIENMPSDTTPKEDLDLFRGTLENYANKDAFYNDTMPDFFNDEQKSLFANAEYMLFNINIGTLFDSYLDDAGVTKDNAIYYSTGMSYRDFTYYSETIFTPKLSAEILNSSEKFPNIRGELFVCDAARGSNILYTGRSFELISQNDNELKFKLIAHYSYRNVLSEEEYKEMSESERDYDEEYTFTMVKGYSGWRFSEFNYWL